MHIIRAKYNNKTNFLISGDFNRVDISDILDSNGLLKQVCSVPTRKDACLELVITDMHSLYHPPTTFAPLQVDVGKKGKNSDHEIVLFAPKSDLKFKKERTKKTIKTRPLPEQQIFKFELALSKYPWREAFAGKSVDEQVTLFHDWLKTNLDDMFPTKTTRFSSLDKK